MHCPILLYRLAFFSVIFPSLLFLASKDVSCVGHSKYRISVQPSALQQGVIKTSVEDNFSIISRAIGKSDIETLRIWLEAGNNANLKGEKGRTLLTLAARDSNAELVKLLLQSGAIANVQDDNGTSPLMMAIMFGHNDIVKVLLKENID